MDDNTINFIILFSLEYFNKFDKIISISDIKKILNIYTLLDKKRN